LFLFVLFNNKFKTQSKRHLIHPKKFSGTASVSVCYRKCYLQCGAHWHVAGYEAIFSVANRLPVS